MSKSSIPQFIRKEELDGSVYEIYHSTDAESAKAFLLQKEVLQDQYYLLVETPEGVWGKDKLGLYLEHLLPFQYDVDAADFTGLTCGLPDQVGLELAANGINESYIGWDDRTREQ